MKAVFASVAIFVAGAFAQLTINTPSNVAECEPSLITWSGGTPPYILSVTPGNTPNGAAIESFAATNFTSTTWTCNIAANTYIDLSLRDSTGEIAQSAPFTINPGSSTTCLNTTSVVPGGASTPAGSSGTASTPGATTTGPAAGTTASASGSASTSTSTSGASVKVAQFGVAGVVGAAVAALFL